MARRQRKWKMRREAAKKYRERRAVNPDENEQDAADAVIAEMEETYGDGFDWDKLLSFLLKLLDILT